jgi:co-chaperonin GroES (HSP10)
MDVTKIRPKGPWILVKLDPLVRKQGSIYLPEDNVDERIGHQTGEVLEAGEGYLSTDKEFRKTGKKYKDHGIQKGDRVIFRGYLKEANRPSQLDREHCLLHAQDIVGIVSHESSTPV